MTHDNTGHYNTGDHNTGDHNTGNRNTGHCNTGYHNTGDWNTGSWNTGGGNTGGHNTGDHNTGFCNTITPEDTLIFNKPAKRQQWLDADKPSWMDAHLTQWVNKADMSDKEKEAYPTYVTIGGYLKCYSTLKAAYVDAWEKATPEDRALTFKLPNFDIEVFKEIFGFTPTLDTKKKIVIDGKEIEISEESFNELKKQMLD